MEELKSITEEFENIDKIRKQLPVIKKIKLHTGLSGYNSPNTYGLYKYTGGNCLGISKEIYTPVDLNMLLDSVVKSVVESGVDIDLSRLSYEEHKFGQKCFFKVPIQKREIKSPLVGDIIEADLVFSTGFDAKTKTSISFYTNRLVCSNGMKKPHLDYDINYKNTKNNSMKYLYFASEIVKTNLDLDNYVNTLNEFCKRKVTQKQIDSFLFDLIGTDSKNYHERKSKSQRIFDDINNSVAMEESILGDMSVYTLMQGITRYTTHNVAKSSTDLLFERASIINQTAFNILESLS
jgi:hypothetical protein